MAGKKKGYSSKKKGGKSKTYSNSSAASYIKKSRKK